MAVEWYVSITFTHPEKSAKSESTRGQAVQIVVREDHGRDFEVPAKNFEKFREKVVLEFEKTSGMS